MGYDEVTQNTKERVDSATNQRKSKESGAKDMLPSSTHSKGPEVIAP